MQISWLGPKNVTWTSHCLGFSNIAPSIVYQVCSRSFLQTSMCVVARLWVRSVSFDNIMCDMCDNIYQEQLVNYLCECEKTKTLRLHFIDSLPSTLQPDEMDKLLSHDSIKLTLILLGAPLDQILGTYQVLPNSSFCTVVILILCNAWNQHLSRLLVFLSLYRVQLHNAGLTFC